LAIATLTAGGPSPSKEGAAFFMPFNLGSFHEEFVRL
jgi:hypothetical protein